MIRYSYDITMVFMAFLSLLFLSLFFFRERAPLASGTQPSLSGCALLHREGVGDERQHQVQRGARATATGVGSGCRRRPAREAAVWASPRGGGAGG